MFAKVFAHKHEICMPPNGILSRKAYLNVIDCQPTGCRLNIWQPVWHSLILILFFFHRSFSYMMIVFPHWLEIWFWILDAMQPKRLRYSNTCFNVLTCQRRSTNPVIISHLFFPPSRLNEILTFMSKEQWISLSEIIVMQFRSQKDNDVIGMNNTTKQKMNTFQTNYYVDFNYYPQPLTNKWENWVWNHYFQLILSKKEKKKKLWLNESTNCSFVCTQTSS